MDHVTHAAIAQLTASHCCVCRAELTDAESVEHGIGPVCSKRYYNPLHEPTEVQVKNALGLLVCSNLPEHIVEGFLKLVDNANGERHVNARKACNLLVYWASCHYDHPDEVFKCSALVRTLGYTELADKLEADRTVAIVREHADHIEAYVPDKHRLANDLRVIPGSKELTDTESSPTGQPVTVPKKIGRKVGWYIPLDQQNYFDAVLGYHCGGELACGDGRIWKIPPKRWHDIREFKFPNQPDPDVPKTTTTAPINGSIRLVPTNNGHFQVFTPYSYDFKEDLKKIPYQERRWNSVETCWEVDKKHEAHVKALIETHYGVEL